MTDWLSLYANVVSPGWISTCRSKSRFFPSTSVLPAQTTQGWKMKVKKEGVAAGSDWAASEH